MGQSVGWRRWAAILVGLVGVLLIIRPGMEGVNAFVWLGVLGMLGLAGRDLATRSIKVVISGAHLSLQAFLSLIPAGLFLVWFEGQTLTLPSLPDSLTLISAAGVALLAYLTIVGATRGGNVASISLFRYTRMVFALILGMAVLGERPDLWTLIGVAIVIAAGLFTLIREARLNRRARGTSQASPEPL